MLSPKRNLNSSQTYECIAASFGHMSFLSFIFFLELRRRVDRPAQKPYFSMAFWWNKNVSKDIFVFFKKKIVESKYQYFFGNLGRKIPKIFLVFHWNPYLKTDCANLPILFSVTSKDFHTRIRENFYIIFLRNVSNNNLCIALGKTQTQKAENQIHKIASEKYRSSCIWTQSYSVTSQQF